MLKKLLRIIGRFCDKFMAKEDYFAPLDKGAKEKQRN